MANKTEKWDSAEWEQLTEAQKRAEWLKGIAKQYGVEDWRETLISFINEQAEEGASNRDRAIAALLASMWNDALKGESWNAYKKPLGFRKVSDRISPFDGAKFSAAYGVVMRYMAYHLSEEEAISEIKRIGFIGDRAAQQFIEKYRGRIASKLASAGRLDGRRIKRIRKL